ncbi:lactonase family protein [Lachnospiraceae bacterium OttesenSCG-928-D06]|nr:lactonase family protein [Lachnospiraceae bacterium OttesenSCG-928-D06]
MQTKLSHFLVTGGYNEKRSDGIRTYKWNPDTEKLSLCFIEEDCQNPSYLVLHPESGIIYAANETEYDAKITAHKLNSEDGTLKSLPSLEKKEGEQKENVGTRGAGMCHMCLNKKGTAIYGGNYNSGNILAFSINEDGSVGSLLSNVYHKGFSSHERQASPHVHQVLFDKDENYLIAVDFGVDTLYAYKVDEKGAILPETVVKSQVPKGEGPRHLVFSQDYKDAYVITELGCKILHMKYHSNTGTFTLQNSLSLLEGEVREENTGAELMFSKSDGFLYASLRGTNEIVAVKTKENGEDEIKEMSIVNRFSCFGQMPRMFSFNEDGRYMFIANQQSGDVTVVKMENQRGRECEKIMVDSVSFAMILGLQEH